MDDPLRRVADWLGVSLTAEQLDLFDRLERWLATEAMAAGGLGPHEGERIRSRHLADSLLFTAGWPSDSPPPASVLDLGSGVGLPGIPLAILWPETEVRLVDRSGRRRDLARRGGRLLGLPLTVVQAELGKYPGDPADLVVARGLAPPDAALRWAGRLAKPGGRVVLGGSTKDRPRPVAGETILEVPAEVLDRRVWLRIMAPT